MAEHFLEAILRHAGLIDVAPQSAHPIVPGAFTPPSDQDEQLAIYVRRAVEREFTNVADCPEGGRNHALNTAAFNLGQLVGGAYIPEHQVIDQLTHAGRLCGLPQDEVDRTVARSVRDGAKSPRRILLAPRDTVAPAYVLDETEPAVPDVEALTDSRFTDFWESSFELKHIQQFARSRMVAPWAMLGECMLRVAATVPPTVRLPAIVGGRASLNTFVALVGSSGSGKGVAAAAARDAFVYDHFPIFEMDAGSGEGIVHAYSRWDNKTKAWERIRDSVLVSVPEIDSLTALAGRQSATLMPVLRKGWSGENLTFGYADPTKRPPVESHSYRLGMSVGVQPDRADALLGDAGGGTPQRFLWLSVLDRDAPDDTPPAPKPLDIAGRLRFADHYDIPVPEPVVQLLRRVRLERLRNGSTETSLDGHLLLCRLKAAAVLALLEGRNAVAGKDWERAGLLIEVSNQTRGSVERHLLRQRNKEVDGRARMKARETIQITHAVDEDAVKKAANWVCGKVEKAGEITWRDLSRAAKTSYRQHLSDAADRLVDAGFIKVVDVPNGNPGRPVSRLVRWSK